MPMLGLCRPIWLFFPCVPYGHEPNLAAIWANSCKILTFRSKMPQYKRKSERRLVFTKELLKTASARIASGESKRKVAKSMGVPESTLQKRLKAGHIPTSLGRFKQVFSKAIETACKSLEGARQLFLWNNSHTAEAIGVCLC